ncbi:STAS domain-containing protein [Streptomyces sp. SS52]|uniref:STAS domain-containing protein n=1 Tax=Streptomyces sp. SS52 TaxID=2563602 RepID=UPI00109E4B02|nr:STAS domain-containing protein [Streptomyces sp. SS52]QCB26574.1 STAS domain-containing protein [Streptomyces sp. SS52]
MNITTIVDGTRARIVPHGEIDYDTLPALRAATAALPAHVTDLLWDIRETTFMDVVGLHLLFDPSEPAASVRTTRVTGLGPQPTRLLTLVSGLNSSSRLELDRVTRL